MNVVGYLDRLTAASGESVSCMISTTAKEVEVDVVRLIHGDTNPAGPGLKVEPVNTIPTSRIPGTSQAIVTGSCMVAGQVLAGLKPSSVTLTAWVCPTNPKIGRVQGIMSLTNDSGSESASMTLTENGQLGAWLARGGSSELVARTRSALLKNRWYEVTCNFDFAANTVTLVQSPLEDSPGRPDHTSVSTTVNLPELPASRVVTAAVSCPRIGRQWRPADVFNGKIERPRVLATLGDTAIASGEQKLIADWQFDDQFDSADVRDASGRGHNGILVNMPTRAVTGHNWTGEILDFIRAPDQYGAIHFHDDDLEDACWDVSTRLTLPDGLRSGVYAVRLTIENEVDHVPFVVTPGATQTRKKILYLIPTFTYQAYANERLLHRLDYEKEGITDHPITPAQHDIALSHHPEYGLSLYDTHSDGSGNCYSSYLRPILNLRPDYRMWLQNAPRHLSADLYVTDWLEAKGYEYDVISDHDLNVLGAEALADYEVIITGSHPEYYSGRMLDGLEHHLAAGGSLMYLGGNGFYWVTSQDPHRPHVVEVRRGHAGTRTWEIQPGEGYHSTTGEPGGLWRHRGRSPNKLVGIGMCSQGWDKKAPGYQRMPDSYSPDAAFIFEKVTDDIIGDFGLVMNGSSGDELDRFDPQYGSPVHTLVLARSTGHSDYYQLVGEDVLMTRPGLGGSTCDLVRSDMVLVEQESGGAVFSVGSICFSGALSHDHYDNNVSKIVQNVLDNFVSRGTKKTHQ